MMNRQSLAGDKKRRAYRDAPFDQTTPGGDWQLKQPATLARVRARDEAEVHCKRSFPTWNRDDKTTITVRYVDGGPIERPGNPSQSQQPLPKPNPKLPQKPIMPRLPT